jgi:hypothetical protein
MHVQSIYKSAVYAHISTEVHHNTHFALLICIKNKSEQALKYNPRGR